MIVLGYTGALVFGVLIAVVICAVFLAFTVNNGNDAW
jgi:hypothetical protein